MSTEPRSPHGRVILLSHRLPVTIDRSGGGFDIRPSDGGLASALLPMHQGGRGIWVGFLGEAPRGRTRKLGEEISERRLVPVPLKSDLLEGYYQGFSNSILWPLLHHLTTLVDLNASWWKAYQKANRLFASAVQEIWRPGDTIWVQDYQLLLVPGMLRERLPEASIGFFLHTPFPSSEVFRILPWRGELLRGLSGADLIGFQTYDDLRHFRSSAVRVLGGEDHGDHIHVDARMIHLGVFPIGIDAEKYREGAKDHPETLRELAQLERDLRGRKLILGIDRMDYTKGIPERLRGYERFLERYTKYHGKVELIQIGVPSRTAVRRYQELRRHVEEIVGHLQGRFGSHVWTPVRYIYRPVSFPRLCALYRHASVALVTPLRDGMNLVAKEFIACQTVGGSGMLVLSEFAGAASELTEAVLVNPYDPDAIATALYEALGLSQSERKIRMEHLAHRVWLGDVKRWSVKFLKALESSTHEEELVPPRLEGARRRQLVAAWSAAPERLLLLDYDGTLRDFVSQPKSAVPDRELLSLLAKLSRMPGVHVAIISGREPETLHDWFGSLPITIASEHGRWLRYRDGTSEDLLRGEPPAWLDDVRHMMEEVSYVTPGSFVERKSASVAWHYRKANAELAGLRLQELNRRLSELQVEPPFDVLQGNKVLEVRVMGVSKAGALVSLLSRTPAADFLLAAGDDMTDEELFAQLPPTAYTVLVGSRPSRARSSVPDPRAFRSLLAELAET